MRMDRRRYARASGTGSKKRDKDVASFINTNIFAAMNYLIRSGT
jgi:hypothetical protein